MDIRCNGQSVSLPSLAMTANWPHIMSDIIERWFWSFLIRTSAEYPIMLVPCRIIKSFNSIQTRFLLFKCFVLLLFYFHAALSARRCTSICVCGIACFGSRTTHRKQIKYEVALRFWMAAASHTLIKWNVNSTRKSGNTGVHLCSTYFLHSLVRFVLCCTISCVKNWFRWLHAGDCSMYRDENRALD